jgi:hypothetical protein
MLRSPIEWSALIVSYLVFGTLGYLMGRRFRRPVHILVLVLIIIATLLAGYVGISTMLISGYGFTIYLNWALQALGLGIILNLLIQRKAPASS